MTTGLIVVAVLVIAVYVYVLAVGVALAKMAARGNCTQVAEDVTGRGDTGPA